MVIDVASGFAELQVKEGAACKGCHAHSCCTLVGEGNRRVTARDPIGVKRGERVLFYILPANVLKASALAFLIPLCGMIVGGFLGYWLGSGLDNPNAAGAVGVIGALLMTAIAFASIKLIDRRYGITRNYLPVIASVLDAEDD